MRIIIQRVQSAEVSVKKERIASIGSGLLLLVGVEKNDLKCVVEGYARKISTLRIFCDDDGKMNRSVVDVSGEVLAVPNFTVAADLSRGNRPSFDSAMPPEDAKILFSYFVQCLSHSVSKVCAGAFGAHMHVSLVNDGPVSFVMEVS